MKNPKLLPVLPLLYIAWADRMLTPSEIEFIRHSIVNAGSLNTEELHQINQWLDPANPPDEKLLRSWRRQIRKYSPDLSEGKKYKLEEHCHILLSIASTGMSNREKQTFEHSIQSIIHKLHLESDVLANGIPTHKPTIAHEDIDLAHAIKNRLDGSDPELRKRVRKFTADAMLASPLTLSKSAYRAKVNEWLQMTASQGWGALAAPDSAGGKNDMAGFITVFETLGYHDLSLVVKFGVQFGLFAGAIQNLGTPEQHKLWLAGAVSLKMPGCFAMTETGHGSNVRDLETTATFQPDDNSFIIHSPTASATKEYIGNAMLADYAVVFARLTTQEKDHGIHAFMLQLRSGGKTLPGIIIEDSGYKMGLNGVDNGKIRFTRVKIPAGNLLSKYATVDNTGIYSSPIQSDSTRFFTMLGTLVGGRVNVPLAGLSAAKTGLSIAINYAHERRQFGPEQQEEQLIMDYPSHQRRLMPLLAEAYALHAALDALKSEYVEHLNDPDKRVIETKAAGLKAVATWFTTRCLQECREACGGKGYLSENRISALKADTDVFTTFEGDNTVLMQLVAKGVLSTFKNEMASGGFISVLRYLGQQLSDTLTGINPIYTRKTDQQHLLDAEFHLHAFEYRERRMRIRLAQRIRGMLKRGISSYDAFLRCQNHLISLAHAWVALLILKNCYQYAETTENEAVKQRLEKLFSLYALCNIENDKGWYLESGYLDGVKTKAIRRMIDLLCAELRVESSILVKAFGIPDEVLAAPIAT